MRSSRLLQGYAPPPSNHPPPIPLHVLHPFTPSFVPQEGQIPFRIFIFLAARLKAIFILLM